MAPDFAALRRNMVDCQLRTYDVTDRAVLAAMDSVPREAFVPEARRDMAYIDQAVALDDFGVRGRALLAPMTVGRMLQSLDVQPGQSFLDYACGTGYTSAIALALGAAVTAYDAEPALRHAARSALAQCGAEPVMVADRLPETMFDLIFVNGACDLRPDSLAEKLAENGKMIFIQGCGRSAHVILLHRSAGAIGGRVMFDSAAPSLPEFGAEPVFIL